MVKTMASNVEARCHEIYYPNHLDEQLACRIPAEHLFPLPYRVT